MSDSGSKGQELLAKAEKKLKGMSLFGNKWEEASEMLEKAANHFKLAKLCASTRVPSSRPAGWECGNPGVEPKAWRGVGARHAGVGPLLALVTEDNSPLGGDASQPRRPAAACACMTGVATRRWVRGSVAATPGAERGAQQALKAPMRSQACELLLALGPTRGSSRAVPLHMPVVGAREGRGSGRHLGRRPRG